MKIVQSTVTQMEISEVQGLDPVFVVLNDLGPGRGRINLECYGQAWAAYWGGMGERTLAQFFCHCDEHYLAGKLSQTAPAIFDPDGLKAQLKSELLAERRKRLVGFYNARSRFDRIEELNLPDRADALWSISQLDELMGPEWWYRLPEKPNPDYVYLCRIIKAVQSALKSIQQPITTEA